MQHKGPNMASDTPVSTKKSLKRLLSYLKKSKYGLIALSILVVVTVVTSLMGPKLTGMMIKSIESRTFSNIPKLAIILILMYLISMICGFIMTIVSIKISQKTVRLMRRDLFDKILDLPISFYDNHQIGDIVSRLTYDIDLVNASLSSDAIQLMKSIIILIFSFVMMLTESWILTLIFLLIVPINLYIARFRMKKVKPLFKKRSKAYGSLNGYSEEMLSSLKTIKAYGIEESIIKSFDDFNSDATQCAYKADYEICKLGPTVNLVNNSSTALIAVIGAILYIYNMISFGGISSFIQYSKKFQGPINEFSNLISEIQSSLAALERVINIIDMDDEYKNKLEILDINECNGKIDFDNVAFGYDSKLLFENLNLNVLENQKIAIVGPTGSGKTTIINLLMRFYDIQKGKIYLDDVDSYEIKLKALRKNYSYVSQEGWIFKGTILDNIKYSNEDATLDDVIKAAKKAQIHDYIMNLPDGYNTVISDSFGLSKGQSQLISIARAILSNAKILILDEATSNVDTKTEQEIEQAILEATHDKTSFIIAHRLQTIVKSDLILVVQDGKIVEQGTHQNLLKADGMYASLFNSQYK